MSVPEIVADPKLLPGRTHNAISQQLRRHGWVNKEASERCRETKAREFDVEARKFLIALLREFRREPFEVIQKAWEPYAEMRFLRPLSTSTIQYWYEKLRIYRPRDVIWNSKHATEKRHKKQKIHFEQGKQRLQLRVEKELVRVRLLAEEFRKRFPKLPTCACGLCKNVWPLSNEFFTFLPGSFTFGSQRLQTFQTEYCKFCYRTDNWKIKFANAWALSDRKIKDVRKRQRRKGLDHIWERELENYRRLSEEVFDHSRHIPRKLCPRCEEVWPERKPFFKANPSRQSGDFSFRALCAFCDAWYLREIDRLKSDGKDVQSLKTERHAYLKTKRSGRHRRRKRA